MSRFKVGDRIERLAGGNSHLVAGRVYTVEHIASDKTWFTIYGDGTLWCINNRYFDLNRSEFSKKLDKFKFIRLKTRHLGFSTKKYYEIRDGHRNYFTIREGNNILRLFKKDMNKTYYFVSEKKVYEL